MKLKRLCVSIVALGRLASSFRRPGSILARTEQVSHEAEGKDRLGTNLTARFNELPAEDVSVAALEGLATFDFNGDIGGQLVGLGKGLGITAISLINPVLGAVVGIFATFFGGGGGDVLMTEIMKLVDTMIKDALGSFANQLRFSHITATLESIKYASEEVHWQIIAHDFLTGAPSMMHPSCWAIIQDNGAFSNSAPDQYHECTTYQGGDVKSLKYELEYSALMASSVAEMLRFKSHALDCRVVSLMTTMVKVKNLLKYHHKGAWWRQRDPSKTVTSGSVRWQRGPKCHVTAVRDTKLKKDITNQFGCMASGTFGTGMHSAYGSDQCGKYKQRLKVCNQKYKHRVSQQFEYIVRQINAFERTIIQLRKKTSRVKGCGI